MGVLTSYALLTAIYLVFGWGIYRMLLSGRKQPAFNRAVILAIYIISLTFAPLAGVVETALAGAPSLEGGLVRADVTTVLIVGLLAGPETHGWVQAMVGLYVAGAAAALLLTLGGILRIIMIIRSGKRIDGDGYTLAVTDRPGVIPFTWGRYIVVGNGEDKAGLETVLRHERSHLRHMHWVDLLLAQGVCVLQWFNPAAWLLRRDLVMIHEYQADQDVLAAGVDEKDYQRLLLERITGRKYKTLLANNLNTNNLKKRIAMMKMKKSRSGWRLSALALLPGMALAYFLTCTPAVASVMALTSAAEFPLTAQAESAAPAAEREVYDAPEVLAEFPGGMKGLMQWLGANLRYPDEETEGRVIVQFVIGETGKVSDVKIVKGLSAAADAESERVVRAMPDWKPGEIGGRPVATRFVLPVSFSKGAPANDKQLTAPIYFVDGKLYEGNVTDLDPEVIESMQIIKDDPRYPNGKISIITIKK
ncbi:MAG: M56 family metallopeptidase [Bacteroides sp.]|nr:M56 family metallopeptidase [Bacteroides sp.]